MNHILITSSEDFELIILKLEASIPNILQILKDESSNIEMINGTDIWSGQAQKAICEKYKELENNFPIIIESLNVYINFLKNTIKSYKELETTLLQSQESNDSNLTVNSR